MDERCAGLPKEKENPLKKLKKIGLWHEIQNRLKYTWFDVVFHADSESIFFLF